MTRSRALLLLAPVAVVALLVGAAYFRAVEPIPETHLPVPGYPLPPEIAERLPEGGEVVVVSETCASCRARVVAYVQHVAEAENRLLVVGTVAGAELFEPALRSAGVEARKVVILPATRLRDATEVAAFPAYLIVDEEGRVTKSGTSSIGWYAGLIRLDQWLLSWRQLVGGTSPGQLDGVRGPGDEVPSAPISIP